MTKNQKYKNAQYKLACEELDVPQNYEDTGQTLIEAIYELKERLTANNDLRQIMSDCNLSISGTKIIIDSSNAQDVEKLFLTLWRMSL